MNNTASLERGLVSIILPTFNAQAFVLESIQSILEQTYTNWELIIVDDGSTDRTIDIIKEINDERIHLIQLETNRGAAIARNTALENVSGEYIAFLDSDDLWVKDKLMYQIAFMKENNYLFTSTNYLEINEEGEKTNVVYKARKRLDYNGVLKYCPGNSTVIYNAKELGIFFIPDIRKRNDFVMWLQVIKKAKYLYGLDKDLTFYRVRENSLSKNKYSLLKYQWQVYRKIEKLSFLKSSYLLTHKILSVVIKKGAKGF